MSRPKKEAIYRRELIKSILERFIQGMSAKEVAAILWDEYKIEEENALVRADLKYMEKKGIVYQSPTDRMWYPEGE